MKKGLGLTLAPLTHPFFGVANDLKKSEVSRSTSAQSLRYGVVPAWLQLARPMSKVRNLHRITRGFGQRFEKN